MNKDGLIDMVFPVINSNKKHEIHIVYNNNNASDTCTYHDVSDDKFEINDFDATETTGDKVVI
jgi:hypothetical protein